MQCHYKDFKNGSVLDVDFDEGTTVNELITLMRKQHYKYLDVGAIAKKINGTIKIVNGNQPLVDNAMYYTLPDCIGGK